MNARPVVGPGGRRCPAAHTRLESGRGFCLGGWQEQVWGNDRYVDEAVIARHDYASQRS